MCWHLPVASGLWQLGPSLLLGHASVGQVLPCIPDNSKTWGCWRHVISGSLRTSCPIGMLLWRPGMKTRSRHRWRRAAPVSPGATPVVSRKRWGPAALSLCRSSSLVKKNANSRSQEDSGDPEGTPTCWGPASQSQLFCVLWLKRPEARRESEAGMSKGWRLNPGERLPCTPSPGLSVNSPPQALEN